MSIDDKLRVLDALSKGDWRIGQLIIVTRGLTPCDMTPCDTASCSGVWPLRNDSLT